MTSKKPTAVGLGGPVPRARRAAPPDEKDDSITATAPAPRADDALLGIPGIVKIHDLEDDGDQDETEAQTLVAQAAAPKPSEADANDDSVTAPAPPAFAADDDPASSLLPPLAPPAAGRPASEDDDQPTARREFPDFDAEDDSVTTQAPIGARASQPSPVGNEPELATARVSSLSPRRRSDKSVPRALDLDSDLQSVVGMGPTLASARDDEPDPQNETAVMPNAPAKPRVGSDSALHVKKPDKPSGEHANPAVLSPSQPRFEASPYAATEPLPPAIPPALDPNAKKPNYTLLVIIAASVSFVLPIVLYLVLSRSQPEPASRAPAVVASDVVPRIDPVRPRKAAAKKR
jgi:hypothetical protein